MTDYILPAQRIPQDERMPWWMHLVYLAAFIVPQGISNRLDMEDAERFAEPAVLAVAQEHVAIYEAGEWACR